VVFIALIVHMFARRARLRSLRVAAAAACVIGSPAIVQLLGLFPRE
jgi:hypothetical protein